MELGNMIFGNSRGNYPVDRDLQDEFYELMQAMGFDGYGFHDRADDRGVFENEVFWMRPYYWGDCACGHEQRACEWSAENPHLPDCYTTKVNDGRLNGRRAQIEAAIKERESHQWESRRYREAHREVERLCALEDKERDKVLKALCAEHGIPWNKGYSCMVHCTCGHDKAWKSWAAENTHSKDCPITHPNFWHKPSGFRLDWYKYPLRDSYSNQPLTAELMRKMFAECAGSLNTMRITDDV